MQISLAGEGVLRRIATLCDQVYSLLKWRLTADSEFEKTFSCEFGTSAGRVCLIVTTSVDDRLTFRIEVWVDEGHLGHTANHLGHQETETLMASIVAYIESNGE